MRVLNLFGFGKNDRENIDEKEKNDLRRVAGILLGSSETHIARLIDAGELQEVKDGEPQAS